MKVLASKQGMFGPVWIADRDDDQRQLMISGQVQGGSVLVDGEPGPIATSAYLSGWLLAGSQNPDSSGLMIGLGSGAGAVALLHNFPDMDLTVVEIDQVVIDLTNQYFPLVSQYQDEGRLRIVKADASEFLAEALEKDDHWDVGYADAYQGDNSVHLPEDMIMGLVGTCDELWFNMIDKPDGSRVKSLQGLLTELHCPLVAWFDANNGYDAGQTRNLILTTQAIKAEAADAFEPYEDLDQKSAEQARTRYIELVSSEHSIGKG